MKPKTVWVIVWKHSGELICDTENHYVYKTRRRAIDVKAWLPEGRLVKVVQMQLRPVAARRKR